MSEVSKLDLRAELLAAEQEAREKKRKAEGKPSAVLSIEHKPLDVSQDDEAIKRRRLLQDTHELDKDDEDDEDEKSDKGEKDDEDEARCVLPFYSLI